MDNKAIYFFYGNIKKDKVQDKNTNHYSIMIRVLKLNLHLQILLTCMTTWRNMMIQGNLE